MNTVTVSPAALVAASALALLGGVGVSVPASAATVSVGTEAELNAAIVAANADADPDVITLTGGGFVLTAAIAPITSDISIVGPGSGDFLIDGADAHSGFTADPGGSDVPTVSISGVTVTRASPIAILVNTGLLTLDDVIVTENYYGVFCGSDASLSIANSIFSNNDDFGVSARLGIDGTAHIENSVFDGNATGLQVFLEDAASATISDVQARDNLDRGVIVASNSVEPVTVSGVDAQGNGRNVTLRTGLVPQGSTATISASGIVATGATTGVGLYVSADQDSVVDISSSTISDNPGGGVFVSNEGISGGTVTLTESTIRGNGDGTGLGAGVQFVNNDGMNLGITATTVSGNSAAQGGGIYSGLSDGASLSVVNSTISGNTAHSAGGVSLTGTGTATISHSTITDNESTASDAAVWVAAAPTTFSHTIVAGNRSVGASADLQGTGITVNRSLVQTANPDATTALSAGVGNIVGRAPQLGPLADNGGPTLTHLPTAESPAVNAGDPTIAGAPALDQRGAARVVGVIDIGSVEIPAVLAATGSGSGAPLAIGAALTLLAGVALVVSKRRRSVHRH